MNFAAALTLSDLGHPLEKSAALQARAQALRETYSEADIRLAGALMKTATELGGDTTSEVHQLFAGLCRHAEPTPGKRKLASIVYTCLGRVRIRQEKQAFNPLPKILAVARAVGGGAAAVTPDLARLIALGGAATGGVASAGLWAANRGITQEDQKLRELEIQRDTYHQLNAEVKSELSRRRMKPTPTNTAAAVDYLT
jgi:hypothetical protein